MKEKYYQKDASDLLLMGLWLKEGGKLQDHVDEFDNLNVDLTNLHKEVSNEDKASLLLS